MVHAIAQLLKRYGSAITLRRDGAEITFRGFLQHTGSKSWQNMRSQFTPLGRVPGGQYVLIAPVSPQLEPGDTLEMGGRNYVLRTLEPVMQADQLLYQWGLCENGGGEDDWADPL